MIRIAQIKRVASVVIGVVTICGGIVGVSRLMAQDASPSAARAAQPAAPATAPAESNGQDVDLSTPQAALRAYAKAARAADLETLQRVTKVDGDELESQLLAASNEYQGAMGELFAAVRAKFGDTEVRKFSRQRGAIPMEPFLRLIEAELDQHDVLVEGDTAKLIDRQDPKNETNIKLVREDGVWKVTSSGLVAHFGEEVATQRMQMLRHRAEILREVAEEVTAGQYENIEAVGNGLREALRR